MIPAISQVCSLPSPFELDIADYAAGRCPAIEIWLTKLETWLKDHSIDDAKRLFDEHEIKPVVASYQGGLLDSQGESRKEAWKLFESRLDLCKQLEIGTMVVAADMRNKLTQESLDRTSVSLTEIASAAGQRGLKVALEFQSRSVFINNLQTASAVVEEVGSPHLGLCLDAFHFETGSSKYRDLGYLTPANLFHVQLCDLADTARELASDSERILPGEGDIGIDAIVEHLRTIGYEGTVSVELMNPLLWQVPPLEFGEISTTALRRILGLAQSG